MLRKIALFGLVAVGLLFAPTERLDPGLNIIRRSNGTIFEGDTLVQNDTIWSAIYSLGAKDLSGYFTWSVDLDSVNGDVTGKVLCYEGNREGNLNRSTTLVTWTTATFDGATLDSCWTLSLIGTQFMRLAVINNSATASDSFYIDELRINAPGN